MGKEDGLAPGEYGTFIWKGNGTKRNGEVGAGDRPFLFDLFSLFFLDFFCFVVFLLVSCFFSLSNYTGLSVTIWRNA